MTDTDGIRKYIGMQKAFYGKAARNSHYDRPDMTDSVVGSYDAHNRWPDYDRFLMRHVDSGFQQKRGLDFGCGPGRNIIKYQHLFAELDGADIAPENLDNARKNLSFHGLEIPRLYLTNGDDLGEAPDNHYDFILSTITLQHICVHEIRLSLLAHMYRCLRKLGRVSIQMGFGQKPGAVAYHANCYDAAATNGSTDVMVENPDHLEEDLRRIGFGNFEYWVRPTGPAHPVGCHPFWIFFTAQK